MSNYAVDPLNVLEVKRDLAQRLVIPPRSGTWCALVDTAFDHGGRSLQWTGRRLSLYSDGPLAGLNAISPQLLPLDIPDQGSLDKQLARLLRHCQGKPMLSFVHTTASPESLFAAWQMVLQVCTDDGQPFVLRFADSRVSPALAASLGAETWTRMTRLLDQWLIINREGQVQDLPTLDQATEAVTGDHQSLKLTASELDKLLHFGLPDALINALDEHFSDLLASTKGALLHRRMQAVCALAKEHDIEDFPDLMALAVADLAMDGQLVVDERLPAWIDQTVWKRGHLDDALSEFMDMVTT
jgi:hypothetical protein